MSTSPSPQVRRARVGVLSVAGRAVAVVAAGLVSAASAGCMAGPVAAAPVTTVQAPAPRAASQRSTEGAVDPVQQALELGERALKIGDLLAAQIFFRQVVAQKPEHPRANYYLGVILEQTGDPEAAKQ